MHPVVLLSLDWMRPGDGRSSLGTASLVSSLRAAGCAVVLIEDAVNRPGFALDDFIAQAVGAIEDVGPGCLVGIGAYVWNEPELQKLVPNLDQAGAGPIVLGGPQVSYVGAGQLEALYPEVDVFVRGHGEAAMVALATGTCLDGLGAHLAGELDQGVRADTSLEQLPSPYLDGTLPIGREVRWETQRGCPFRCSFCQHREPGARLRNRHLGRDRIRAELRAFADAGVRRIAVLDPIFHADRSRAVELLAEARMVGLRACLSLQCRFELVDTRFLDALEGLEVELEFGLQTIHPDEARAVGRPNRMDRVAEVADQLLERSIPFEVSLIYGLPLQTLERFRASVTWCRDRGVPRVRAWPLMLLRGTPLHAERHRWGFVESVGDRIPVVVESHTFTREEHAEMERIAADLEAR